MPSRVSSRVRALAVCAALVAALLAVAAFAPLPYSIVLPGLTADTLGKDRGKPVVVVSGTGTRPTTGKLLLTTIAATQPNATVRFTDVWHAWWDDQEAAMPRSSVYPEGDSVKEIEKHNTAEMAKSQNAATAAALKHLGLSSKQIQVKLNLADVGGPSAGLMFTLGIIDKIDGDGRGGDLTGGRTIAGTGTITPSGQVGPVGGVPLKEQAAKRDGATVFLVPRAECSEAKSEQPAGLRLVPVRGLDDAIASLKALNGHGGSVPSC
nr:S16 family serine protease [Wenjunlia tyrosinilytica]